MTVRHLTILRDARSARAPGQGCAVLHAHAGDLCALTAARTAAELGAQDCTPRRSIIVTFPQLMLMSLIHSKTHQIIGRAPLDLARGGRPHFSSRCYHLLYVLLVPFFLFPFPAVFRQKSRTSRPCASAPQTQQTRLLDQVSEPRHWRHYAFNDLRGRGCPGTCEMLSLGASLAPTH